MSIIYKIFMSLTILFVANISAVQNDGYGRMIFSLTESKMALMDIVPGMHRVASPSNTIIIESAPDDCYHCLIANQLPVDNLSPPDEPSEGFVRDTRLQLDGTWIHLHSEGLDSETVTAQHERMMNSFTVVEK